MTARRPSASRTTRHHADSGASLLLAIGFVVMVGAISAGLVGLTTSSLNDGRILTTVRNRQYAADGAVEQAIARIRLQIDAATVAGAPDSSCTTGVHEPIIDTLTGVTIRVDWVDTCGAVQSADGSAVARHEVLLRACVSTGAACAPDDVLLRATVELQQALGGTISRTFVRSWVVAR